MYKKADSEIGINLNPLYRPIVLEGNALNLRKIIKQQNIKRNEVKLICVHPPYLDSIKYTNNKNDLGNIKDVDIFIENIRVFTQEVKRVLAKDGICAVLIGDVRKNKKIVPLGLKVLNVFLVEGFNLENIIILAH